MTIGTIDNNGKRQLSTGIAGVSDNDIVIETGDVSQFFRHRLSNVAGQVDVDVSADGTNFVPLIALTDLESLAPATKVLTTQAAGQFGFDGFYKNIRVRQQGVTAATGSFLHSE